VAQWSWIIFSYCANVLGTEEKREIYERLGQGWRTIMRTRDYGNFEEQNSVMELSIIIINHCIVIIIIINVFLKLIHSIIIIF
jgi:hypothetical protein